jgi:hypothetical protein
VRAVDFLAVSVAIAAASCARADEPARRGSLRFDKRVIDPAFRSEGVTVFDVDRDGHLDIVTEEQWYRGPELTPHPLRAPRAWDPYTEYAHCFAAFHDDVDRDGYEDLIVFGPPGEDASWCQNPRGEEGTWACHTIAPSASGESPFLADVLGDGKRRLFMGIEPERLLGWMVPGPSEDAPWTMRSITEPGFPMAARYEHGLGLGDVNGDGRADILTGSGWLEQPADPGAALWTWHPVEICPNNCAHMFAYDVSGDGLADLVGTSPHGYGAFWWEQRRGAEGGVSFVRHEIDLTSSQNHAARFVDLDGDGRPELVTGKRWYAHFTQDPGALEPALLLLYRFEREGGTVRWTRTVIDDDSGIGSQFEIVDVDGDGWLDVVVSNKKGLTLFRQR